MPRPALPVHRVLALNGVTLLYSLAGVLIRDLHLPALQVAGGRSLAALAVLLLVVFARRLNPLAVRSPRHWAALLVLGLLVAGNWYTYILSIQLAGVAVAVVALFTYPLIAALIEPWVFGERYQAVDLIGTAAVLAGVTLIVPSFTLTDRTFQGVALGVVSAACVAGFGILSRRLVRTYPTTTVLFFQFAVPALLFGPFVGTGPLTGRDAGKLVLLGAGLTALAQLLFVQSLRSVRMTLVAIVLSLQPLYTVLLAWVLLGDVPALRTVAGGAVICSAVLAVTLAHAYARRGEQRTTTVVAAE
ncbi:MAG TPA: DMT family transporter [Tepidisphaeraceae bacterium]|nr:DMT family transporter [Tepidisphaeraceae bacterium]